METHTLSEQLRASITASGLSLNQLGKVCAADSARLSRFMRGERGLTLETIDRIFLALNLELVAKRPAAGRKGKG